MTFQPGQSGNPTGRAKDKIWTDALRRALLRKEKGEDKQAIEKLADKCLALAMAGDVSALKEIGNRLDGMPVQAQEIDLRTDPLIIKR